jgi:hypothetical protein
LNILTKREKVTGGWRKLLNESFVVCSLCQKISRVIKSRWTSWIGHVACIGEVRMLTKFWIEYSKGTKHSEDIGVNGRLTLKLILK